MLCANSAEPNAARRREREGRGEQQLSLLTEEGVEEEIPRTEAAEKRDLELDEIKAYLEELELPKGMDERGTKRFLRKASDFYIGGGKLWRRGRDGMPKRVITDRRRRIIRKNLNDLPSLA